MSHFINHMLWILINFTFVGTISHCCCEGSVPENNGRRSIPDPCNLLIWCFWFYCFRFSNCLHVNSLFCLSGWMGSSSSCSCDKRAKFRHLERICFYWFPFCGTHVFQPYSFFVSHFDHWVETKVFLSNREQHVLWWTNWGRMVLLLMAGSFSLSIGFFSRLPWQFSTFFVTIFFFNEYGHCVICYY